MFEADLWAGNRRSARALFMFFFVLLAGRRSGRVGRYDASAAFDARPPLCASITDEGGMPAVESHGALFPPDDRGDYPAQRHASAMRDRLGLYDTRFAHWQSLALGP